MIDKTPTQTVMGWNIADAIKRAEQDAERIGSGKTLALLALSRPREPVNQQLVQAALVKATFLYATYQASFGKSESDRRWVMSTLAAQLRDAGLSYSEVEQTISRMMQVIRNV